MKTIRTILIEDQKESLFSLSKKISDNCKQLQIVGQAMNVQDALKLIETTHPDLIFLDIQLGTNTKVQTRKRTIDPPEILLS